MANEMRTIPVETETVTSFVFDIGNARIEFKSGMLIYNKAASRIVVNGNEVLNVPKRRRIPSTSVTETVTVSKSKK